MEIHSKTEDIEETVIKNLQKARDKIEDKLKEAVFTRLKHTGNLSILGKFRFITILKNSQPIWVKTQSKNNLWNFVVVNVLPDIL